MFRRNPKLRVVPAKAGTHNHRRSLFRAVVMPTACKLHGRGVWVPAFAGTTENGSAGTTTSGIQLDSLQLLIRLRPLIFLRN